MLFKILFAYFVEGVLFYFWFIGISCTSSCSLWFLQPLMGGTQLGSRLCQMVLMVMMVFSQVIAMVWLFRPVRQIIILHSLLLKNKQANK